MNNRWFYRTGDLEVGPISFAGLRRMILEGIIDADTPVREDRNDEWMTANDVQKLFAPQLSMADRAKRSVPASAANEANGNS
jgi:hypothetical protein